MIKSVLTSSYPAFPQKPLKSRAPSHYRGAEKPENRRNLCGTRLFVSFAFLIDYFLNG